MASVQELSSRYGTQLRQLKSIFPEWDEGDLAFTLQDTKGNVDEAAMMITEGESRRQFQWVQADHLFLPLLYFRYLLSLPHRPSIAIHRSNHKEEGLKGSN